MTGRQYRDEVERYELVCGGREVVMELYGPVGADNVDAYRTMIAQPGARVTAAGGPRACTGSTAAGATEVAALLDVSLPCAAGETVAVTGPSGSGSPRCSACSPGWTTPTAGTVLVGGDRLSHTVRGACGPPAGAARSAMLTQSSGLLGHLTVLDERPARRACASSPAAAEGPARPSCSTGSASPRSPDARPQTLSGGETARAGLAVALAGAPDLLLADEPTAEVSAAEERDGARPAGGLAPARAAPPCSSPTPTRSRPAPTGSLHLLDGRLEAA